MKIWDTAEAFTIYDADDQRTLMKQILKKNGAGSKAVSGSAMLSAISNAKNELIGREEFRLNAEETGERKTAEVYHVPGGVEKTMRLILMI